MDINISKYVADKIKYYREKNNITQQELAEYLNTTQQSIARYENNERKANNDVLFSLADYFKVSINDFFPPLSIKNENIFNETQVLFDKYNQLNEEDRKFISTYIEEKKKQIDKEKNEE